MDMAMRGNAGTHHGIVLGEHIQPGYGGWHMRLCRLQRRQLYHGAPHIRSVRNRLHVPKFMNF